MPDKDANVMVRHTKHFYHLAMIGALFGVLCIPTSGKTIDIFGTPYSISIFYFPFIYIIADMMTEVYGYALARRALWYSIIAQIISTIVFGFVAITPASVTMDNNEAFRFVLSQAPYIVGVGIVAIFTGDIVNNYIVARMKIATDGKYMGLRFVASTLGSELINTAIFYFCALGLTGIIPMNAILPSIVGATIAKTLVEIVTLPITLRLARKLKQVEGIDFYDRGTNFNPLKF